MEWPCWLWAGIESNVVFMFAEIINETFGAVSLFHEQIENRETSVAGFK